MATVIAKVLGGQPKEIEASTLGEVKRIMNVDNYQASLNGTPEDNDSLILSDYAYITLTEKTKGA